MATVTVDQMREIERDAMAAGLSEGELMERAGIALGRAIGNQYPNVGTAVGYVGKGHNGGDALIALRVLEEEFGWKIGIRSVYPMDQLADLTRRQWESLGPNRSFGPDVETQATGPLLLLDGLLGTGAKGGLQDPLKGLADEMAWLRNHHGAKVLAVDLPSGVDPDHGEIFPGAVTADRTFMIGAAKRGLLFSRAANAVGQLALVEVKALNGGGESQMELICPQSMDVGKNPRPFEFHKVLAGKVGIVAGSDSFTGAALLAALGAVRAGAGLTVLYVRSAIHDAVLSRLPLEAMVMRCDVPQQLLSEHLDAMVIGPGLGQMSHEFSDGLAALIENTQIPTVIDADGLNLVAQRGIKMSSRHVLTPHPGEFSRLAAEPSRMGREEGACQFVGQTDAVLLLKGARTIVARQGKALRVNSTGTPAMSNGGQGDLLSGVIGGLLAGGMVAYDAAAYGAWLCGHAAELAEDASGGIVSATRTADHIGRAMNHWRAGSNLR